MVAAGISVPISPSTPFVTYYDLKRTRTTLPSRIRYDSISRTGIGVGGEGEGGGSEGGSHVRETGRQCRSRARADSWNTRIERVDSLYALCVVQNLCDPM